MGATQLIKLRCTTNLDVYGENWPTELPVIPPVGSYIRSSTRHGKRNIQIELMVCSIRFEPQINTPAYSTIDYSWHVVVELGLPKHPFVSISHFDSWYDYIRDKITQDEYIKRTNECMKAAYVTE